MKLSSLAEAIGAELRGDDGEVTGCAGLEDASPASVAFYANPSYREALEATHAGAVLVDQTTADQLGPRPRGAWLVHGNPYAAYGRALEAFHPEPVPEPGVHPTAVVDPTAQVDASATIGPLCVVSAGAIIGPGTHLVAQVFIGEGARLGASCHLQPQSVVREGCVLGDRVRLQPGVLIGGDGFGYALDQDDNGPFHRKLPQVGIVALEDDVEVGAGACIDRATTGETRIGRGTKIDNLVQVGHNSTVGPLSILCGQVGLAGSSHLGTGVVLGGQVGIAGHLTVGDGAQVAAQSGVMHDVPPGATWFGSPAVDSKQHMRMFIAMKRLPELLPKLKRLIKSTENG